MSFGSRPPTSARGALWLLSGSQDHETRIWEVSSAQCLTVLSHHCAPVTALQCHGAQLATLAAGDGLAAFIRAPFDPSLHEGPGAAESEGGRGRGRGTLGVRAEVARARGVPAGEGESVGLPGMGLEQVLSLLDGAGVSFAASLAMDRKGLALGTQVGELCLYDFAAA